MEWLRSTLTSVTRGSSNNEGACVCPRVGALVVVRKELEEYGRLHGGGIAREMAAEVADLDIHIEELRGERARHIDCN